MAGFEELLGIFTQQDDAREAFARMNITDQHLNTSGICHGGFVATLAIAAAKRCVSPSLTLISLDYRYLRPTPHGTLATARARLIKRGSLITAVEVQVHADEALVGQAFCEFAEQRVDLSSVTEGTLGAARFEPQFYYTKSARELADLSNEDLMRALGVLDRGFFGTPPAQPTVTCAGLHTDERLSDGDFLHPGLLALIADNTLGLAAFATMGKWRSAVTTSLKLNCALPVPVGEELNCTAHLSMRSGQVLTLQSELWANGRQIGICSGNFFAIL